MNTSNHRNYTSVAHYRPLVGADPEVFVYDKEQKVFVSPHEHFSGTKTEPEPREYGARQIDGLALEFNITPASSLIEFARRIREGVSDLAFSVNDINENWEIRALPVAQFSQEYMDSLPPHVKALGCDPDFNAQQAGKVNRKPRANGKTLIRTGGGHLHLGWLGSKYQVEDPHDEGHLRDCIEHVQIMDALLYIPSLLWDTDTERQTLYGKPGAFRPKKYGVEYRTLSNAWLNDPLLIAWIYNAIQRVSILHDYDYNPTTSDAIVQKILTEGAATRGELLACYDFLVFKYDIPHLPRKYLGDTPFQHTFN